MDLGLRGKRALVLGASKGLGHGIARALAAEGAEVVISARRLESLDPVAKAMAVETGARVVALEGDVSDPDNMNRLYDGAVKALGGVDVLVNNHGGPPLGLAVDLAEGDLKTWFTNMVVSMIRMTGLAFPPMRARKWGRILTVGSSGMIQPLPNMVLSNTLRSAVVGYMKTLADEVAPDGVTVNIIVPGSIYTDRTRQSTVVNAKRLGISEEEMIKRRVAAIPVGRFGRTEEFGAMAAFLCSEAAAYMTGSMWRVDGGLVRSII
ncbi:MAG: SDR family oxidoreductase [Proteobacteria bacterium]|nr:SDR family oxidoreductase [Pseudomonadota bacterium]